MRVYGKSGSCRRRRMVLSVLAALLLAVVAGTLCLLFWGDETGEDSGEPPLFMTPARRRVEALKEAEPPDWIDRQYIPTLITARSGRRLTDYTGVVIHYVGNPGSTAAGNRNYFATPGTEVCSHFVVGLTGEIIQCVPLWERSVASNSRNTDTISVEVCHPDDTGKFTPETEAALVKLTAWLCRLGELDAGDVIRHHDITGKECPRYYVRNETAWENFRRAVSEALSVE